MKKDNEKSLEQIFRELDLWNAEKFKRVARKAIVCQKGKNVVEMRTCDLLINIRSRQFSPEIVNKSIVGCHRGNDYHYGYKFNMFHKFNRTGLSQSNAYKKKCGNRTFEIDGKVYETKVHYLIEKGEIPF